MILSIWRHQGTTAFNHTTYVYMQERKIQIRSWTFCLDGREIKSLDQMQWQPPLPCQSDQRYGICHQSRVVLGICSLSCTHLCTQLCCWTMQVFSSSVCKSWELDQESSVWMLDVLLGWQHDRALQQPPWVCQTCHGSAFLPSIVMYALNLFNLFATPLYLTLRSVSSFFLFLFGILCSFLLSLQLVRI